MIDVNDVLAIGGLVLAMAGAWLIAPAAALLFFGCVLCVVGVLRQRPKGGR